MEEWRILSCNPKYEISNSGNIRRTSTKRLLSPPIDRHGYKHIRLYDNRKATSHRIHRLVAEEFLEHEDGCDVVNHLDGNKLNNNYRNLEWCTQKENVQHAWQTGLSKPSYGMLGKHNFNGGRKSTEVMIVETGEVFNSVEACAKHLNRNSSRVYDCINGKTNSCAGYTIKYLK